MLLQSTGFDDISDLPLTLCMLCHVKPWVLSLCCVSCMVRVSDTKLSSGRPFNMEDPLNQATEPPEQPDTGASEQQVPKMHYGMEWAVLAFDRPLLCLPGSVMISTKFDLDLEQAGAACRIAFYGNVAHILEDASEQQKLKLFRVRLHPAAGSSTMVYTCTSCGDCRRCCNSVHFWQNSLLFG